MTDETRNLLLEAAGLAEGCGEYGLADALRAVAQEHYIMVVEPGHRTTIREVFPTVGIVVGNDGQVPAVVSVSTYRPSGESA